MDLEFGLTYCQWLLNHNLKIVSHYLERAQYFLFVTLRNLGNECDKPFTSTTLTLWVMLIVILLSVIYHLYRKVLGVFLKRMTLPMLYRRHLTKTLWNAGFCINAILFCITKLLERANHVADIFFNVDNSFRTEQTSPAHVLFSCVIFAYYIHSICLMYVQKGIDTEFFAKGLLLTFLYTCYSLRYVRTGLSAVVLINVYSLNVEFMRICYCLNQSKATKSGFMRNLTCALFVIHCVLWGGMFLLVLPKFYLLPAINIEVSDENLLLLTVLCATLWAYLWLGISNAGFR
ncbi:uncharacterized protein LOC110840277 isoform X2 [Zootermopsis nevadensis]|uniref:uncharacterized protein LOC110840277 isoform X2 n=1 Tax=Zootermopsis nevadensis TaxID=136037 RepID=UPI000B8E6497|nr:uncharacterized protein LOC110840277 isoform X2 [Zootermopsis nevadensis]